MGSTYLDLTNRVLRRLNEVEITSSDFSSVRGVHAAAKDAVLDTVREINSQKFEWPFNAAQGTQVLTVGQELYSWPTDLRIPDWDSFYIQMDDTIGNSTVELEPISKERWYHEFRDLDLDSDTDGRNIPNFVFPSDSGGFGVTPSPNEAYTVKFRYFVKTIDLETYDDTTTIPTEYDHVITYGALRHMYIFFDNDQRYQIARDDFERTLENMTYILIPKAPKVYSNQVNRRNPK